MLRFFYSKGNPFYIQPVNFNFNYPDHVFLNIFIRRQQKEPLSSCILHFYSTNASHLILLPLLSGQIEAHPGPIKRNCGVSGNETKKNYKAINCDKCQLWCRIQCICSSEDYYNNLISQGGLSWICCKCEYSHF